MDCWWDGERLLECLLKWLSAAERKELEPTEHSLLWFSPRIEQRPNPACTVEQYVGMPAQSGSEAPFPALKRFLQAVPGCSKARH
jgi:hypothetical protein